MESWRSVLPGISGIVKEATISVFKSEQAAQARRQRQANSKDASADPAEEDNNNDTPLQRVVSPSLDKLQIYIQHSTVDSPPLLLPSESALALARLSSAIEDEMHGCLGLGHMSHTGTLNWSAHSLESVSMLTECALEFGRHSRDEQNSPNFNPLPSPYLTDMSEASRPLPKGVSPVATSQHRQYSPLCPVKLVGGISGAPSWMTCDEPPPWVGLHVYKKEWLPDCSRKSFAPYLRKLLGLYNLAILYDIDILRAALVYRLILCLDATTLWPDRVFEFLELLQEALGTQSRYKKLNQWSMVMAKWLFIAWPILQTQDALSAENVQDVLFPLPKRIGSEYFGQFEKFSSHSWKTGQTQTKIKWWLKTLGDH